MIIHRLELEARNLDALARFYNGNLGFPVQEEKELLTIQAGYTELCFRKSKQHAIYHFALNIAVNLVEEALLHVESFTTPLSDPDTGRPVVDFPDWNANAIYFNDPEGNVVELIARHNLKHKVKHGFDERAVLGVSEIGTPTASVLSAFDRLHLSTGLHRYSGNFSSFCAVGDEEGLFILTDFERNWFPTSVPSVPWPYRLKADINGKNTSVHFDAHELLISQ